MLLSPKIGINIHINSLNIHTAAFPQHHPLLTLSSCSYSRYIILAFISSVLLLLCVRIASVAAIDKVYPIMLIIT